MRGRARSMRVVSCESGGSRSGATRSWVGDLNRNVGRTKTQMDSPTNLDRFFFWGALAMRSMLNIGIAVLVAALALGQVHSQEGKPGDIEREKLYLAGWD